MDAAEEEAGHFHFIFRHYVFQNFYQVFSNDFIKSGSHSNVSYMHLGLFVFSFCKYPPLGTCDITCTTIICMQVGIEVGILRTLGSHSKMMEIMFFSMVSITSLKFLTERFGLPGLYNGHKDLLLISSML